MLFVVRTEADLRLPLRVEGILHPFRKPPLLIRIPALSEPEARAWERRLENLRQQCGYTAGALATGAFVVLFVVCSLHKQLDGTRQSPAGNIGTPRRFFVAGLILSALIGKFLGLSMARIRFRRTCVDMHKRVQAIEAEG